MDKELRKVVKALQAQGFEVTYTKRGHVRVWCEGTLVTTFSGTSGDQRGLKNGIAKARQAGFVWPPRK